MEEAKEAPNLQSIVVRPVVRSEGPKGLCRPTTTWVRCRRLEKQSGMWQHFMANGVWLPLH